MTAPAIINNDNFDETNDAIREIVMLYVGLAEEGRFTHNLDAEGGSTACALSTRRLIPGPIGATWSC